MITPLIGQRKNIPPMKPAESNITPPSENVSPYSNTPILNILPSPKVLNTTPGINFFQTPRIGQPQTPRIGIPQTPKIGQLQTSKLCQVPSSQLSQTGQLSVPRIGSSYKYSGEVKQVFSVNRLSHSNNEKDPWIIKRNFSHSEVKIAGITPLGTIAHVPTAIRKSVPTPRRVPIPPPRNISDSDSEEGLVLSFYLNKTCKDDNYVAEKMRSISENSINLQKQYSNYLLDLPNIFGNVSHKVFENALLVYENNQVYYQDQLEDKTLDETIISEKLTELERWFMNINEPTPIDKDDVEMWQERNTFKQIKGISAYCDPLLHKYINSAK